MIVCMRISCGGRRACGVVCVGTVCEGWVGSMKVGGRQVSGRRNWYWYWSRC